MGDIIPLERIENRIFLIRGLKIMLSAHLSELYGVEHRVLMQAVKRNIERFPEDFMFQLDNNEYKVLKSQIVISNRGRGGVRHNPYAFTEQGVAMLSSVLRSKRAVEVNIQIMRTFVKLREMLISHEELARKLKEMEKKYDKQFAVVFKAIAQLMTPPEKKKGKVGFQVKGNENDMY